MEEKLAKTLAERCAVQPGDRLLLGASGGPDSLCLLDLLLRLGFSPVVAHFDHCLRPESGRDADQVRAWAEESGLRFILGRQDVRAYAAAHSLSLEEAARETRYRFLFDSAREVKAGAVAVAHTADDQVETILMHLLRGSGMAGLRGMAWRALPNPWSQELPLIRPLLGFWRSEILDYCTARGLQPLYDSTNQDTAFFRNRLRHELIPYLGTFNPEFEQVLWRTGELARGDYELVQNRVQAAWQACSLESGPGYVGLRLDALAAQPVAVQRYLIRQAASMLRPGLRDIGYQAVERALDYLAQAERPAQIDWTAGLRLTTEPGRLWVTDWQAEIPTGSWPRFPRNTELAIVLGQPIELEGGWELHAVLADIQAAIELAGSNGDAYQAWLALDAPESRLVLRTRRPGDRIRPLGMPEGSIKVSNLMINLKVPARARPGWPLIVINDDIAWVPGCRISHQFRLSPLTRRAIHLRLVRVAASPLI